MESIESIIKFMSSYPIWAKGLVFGNVICIAATLVFAPRVVSDTAKVGSSDRYSLRIDRVGLFPSSTTAIFPKKAANFTRPVFEVSGGRVS